MATLTGVMTVVNLESLRDIEMFSAFNSVVYDRRGVSDDVTVDDYVDLGEAVATEQTGRCVCGQPIEYRWPRDRFGLSRVWPCGCYIDPTELEHPPDTLTGEQSDVSLFDEHMPQTDGDTVTRRGALSTQLAEIFVVVGETADLFILFFIYSVAHEMHTFETGLGAAMFLGIVTAFLVFGGVYRVVTIDA